MNLTYPVTGTVVGLQENLTYQATHSNIQAIAIKVKIYCNGNLHEETSIDHFLKNGDNYSFFIELGEYMKGYFANSAETVCNLTGFHNTSDLLSAKVKVRVSEMLPDANNILQEQTSFVETSDFFVMNTSETSIPFNNISFKNAELGIESFTSIFVDSQINIIKVVSRDFDGIEIDNNYLKLTNEKVNVINWNEIENFSNWLDTGGLNMVNANSIEVNIGFSQYANTTVVSQEPEPDGNTENQAASRGVSNSNYLDTQIVSSQTLFFRQVSCEEIVVIYQNRFGCPSSVVATKGNIEPEIENVTFKSKGFTKTVYSELVERFKGIAAFQNLNDFNDYEAAKGFMLSNYYRISNERFILDKFELDYDLDDVSFEARKSKTIHSQVA